MVHIDTFLREPGADCEDVYRPITTFPDGCGTEALLAGLPIRSSYFSGLAPAKFLVRFALSPEPESG